MPTNVSSGRISQPSLVCRSSTECLVPGSPADGPNQPRSKVWSAVPCSPGRSATLMATFTKFAINVAERPGEQGNALHTLLRGWFGPSAGLPGTKHSVLLRQTSDGWEIRPDETLVGIQREVG